MPPGDIYGGNFGGDLSPLYKLERKTIWGHFRANPSCPSRILLFMSNEITSIYGTSVYKMDYTIMSVARMGYLEFRQAGLQ